MTNDTTAPERIWALAMGGWDGYLEATSSGRTCPDEVEYVRATALEAAQARIAELEGALRDCLRIIDETMKESGRHIEYDEEDPFRMGEWFEESDIADTNSARAALEGKG